VAVLSRRQISIRPYQDVTPHTTIETALNQHVTIPFYSLMQEAPTEGA
jgi:hypothetical protein